MTMRRWWRDERDWVIATVWLVFLAFPIASVWADDFSFARKLGATAALIVFAGVYIQGFRVLACRGQTEKPSTFLYFVALVGLAMLVFAVAGWEATGAAAFVVAFAAFHLSWRAAITTVGVTVAVIVVGSITQGVLGELWFLPLIVASVGIATLFMRTAEEQQSDRAELQTQLAVSEERTRVARDVHDVLGHSLTVVVLKAELCRRLLEPINPTDDEGRRAIERCRAELEQLHSTSRQALTEIRTTVGGLRTTTVVDELAAARSVLADAGVRLMVTGDHAQVPDRYQPVLAWVVRESATNIVRHAKASTCRVQFMPSSADGDELDVVLRIQDDGAGFGDSREGNGLTGLRERVHATGAALKIHPGARSGTSGSDGTKIEVVV